MNLRRVLITGAAENLGAKLVAHLSDRRELVLLDKPDGELSVWDERWVSRFEGGDAVVHLAGDPVAYHSWDELTGPNIDAVLNVIEAAVRAGVKRLIFASSNHVMGASKTASRSRSRHRCLPSRGCATSRTEPSASVARMPPRSCSANDSVSTHYATTRHLEVIAVRIGWVWHGTNEPSQLPADRGEWFRRMWLSDRDFPHLMDCCLTAALSKPFVIVNGMSNNTGMRWDLSGTEEVIGYRPQDTVERRN
jgi:nucleoside-diphosphate-sugar epimerase